MRGACQSRLDMLQPVRVRMSLSFPDKRLIQWDCGKLQVPLHPFESSARPPRMPL